MQSIKDVYLQNMKLTYYLIQLQAYFLVADDMMDGSITRRGQPCWYRKEGVSTIAINDSFILESCIFLFLKKYFKETSYYIDLVELFHEVNNSFFPDFLIELCYIQFW